MKQNKQKKTQATRQLNKRQLERLIIIHNAIKSGMYPNNKKLRQFYCEQTGYGNVGEATIQRSIEDLRTYFDAPIEYDWQKGGFYYLDNNFDLKLNNISPQDAFYLSAAKTLLSSFEGTPVYNSISNVINFVTDTQCVGKSNLLKRIAVPPAPKVVLDEKVWKDILGSLNENLIIEFDYKGRWHTEITHRRVHPYQILMDEGQCFLFAYSEERKAERIFLLNRMKNLVITDEHFELPKDFEFSLRCGGGKFGAFMSDKTADFVVDFYEDACEYVKECVWADNQKLVDFDDEEKTRVSFSSTQWLKVLEWVLAQGANAVPVSPKWFVDEWKEEVRGMAENSGFVLNCC